MTDYFNPVDVMISKEERPGKHKVASVATKAIQSAQKLSVATHFRTVAQKYKLNNLASLYDFLRGDLTLIADLPEFCYLENLPQNFRYIGPLIWEGFNHTVPDYLKEFNSSQKLIYATTGNTGKEKLIQLVIDAFGNDNSYQVILTTGAFIHSDSLPNISNIHVAKFIPGSEIIKQSQVVIHCGGNGTTYQTLSQGIPAVAIPFNNDQNINAWLIKKHKLGIPLSPSELTGKQLKLAVKKVVEDLEIQNNLQHFKELLAKTNAPKSAAKEIMSFLTTFNYPRKMIATTENCQGNKQLTLHDPSQSPLSVQVVDLTLTQQDNNLNECRLTFEIDPELYQRIDTKALFNLKPELRGSFSSGSFQPEKNIKIEATLKPELLPQVREHTANSDELLAYLLNLGQHNLTTTPESLLFTENWFALQLTQSQESGETGYRTFWDYSPPAITQESISCGQISQAMVNFVKDLTNADISVTEEDISAAFDEILKVFKEWVDSYQLGIAPDGTSSKSIFQKVVKFFLKDDWQFAKLEAESTLRLAFQGKNGKWKCYAKAREKQQQFVFYSVCPIKAQENKHLPITEFITRANYGMIMGNFEFDFPDGEILYKTSIDAGNDKLTYELIKQVVYTNVMMMDKYQPGIIAVIENDVLPEEAIKQIES